MSDAVWEWALVVTAYVTLILIIRSVSRLSIKQTILLGLLPVGWPFALVFLGFRAAFKTHTPPDKTGE